MITIRFISLIFLGNVLIADGLPCFAQLKGKVVASDSQEPLSGASVYLHLSDAIAITDANGHFAISVSNFSDTLRVSYIGYEEQRIPLRGTWNDTLHIFLHPLELSIEEVDVNINTGYYRLPKERLTGAFDFIESSKLVQSNQFNLIDRIDGMAPGIQFDRRRSTDDSEYKEIRIRGVSTLYADRTPLIILDDFPYEGDLDNINPDDIEHITY